MIPASGRHHLPGATPVLAGKEPKDPKHHWSWPAGQVGTIGGRVQCRSPLGHWNHSHPQVQRFSARVRSDSWCAQRPAWLSITYFRWAAAPAEGVVADIHWCLWYQVWGLYPHPPGPLCSKKRSVCSGIIRPSNSPCLAPAVLVLGLQAPHWKGPGLTSSIATARCTQITSWPTVHTPRGAAKQVFSLQPQVVPPVPLEPGSHRQ